MNLEPIMTTWIITSVKMQLNVLLPPKVDPHLIFDLFNQSTTSYDMPHHKIDAI